MENKEKETLLMLASKVMQGILSAQTEKRAYGGYNNDQEIDYLVEESFRIAQRMLDEYKK